MSCCLAPSHERHRVATNIYKTYINRFGSAVRDEIDNATTLRMKSFLVGEEVSEIVGAGLMRSDR